MPLPLSLPARSCWLALIMIGVFAGRCSAEDDKPTAVKKYPLDCCVVSNDKLDPAVPGITYKNQEFRFCCKGCVKKFNRDPDRYLGKLEAAEKAKR